METGVEIKTGDGMEDDHFQIETEIRIDDLTKIDKTKIKNLQNLIIGMKTMVAYSLEIKMIN